MFYVCHGKLLYVNAHTELESCMHQHVIIGGEPSPNFVFMMHDECVGNNKNIYFFFWQNPPHTLSPKCTANMPSSTKYLQKITIESGKKQCVPEIL